MGWGDATKEKCWEGKKELRSAFKESAPPFWGDVWASMLQNKPKGTSAREYLCGQQKTFTARVSDLKLHVKAFPNDTLVELPRKFFATSSSSGWPLSWLFSGNPSDDAMITKSWGTWVDNFDTEHCTKSGRWIRCEMPLPVRPKVAVAEKEELVSD